MVSAVNSAFPPNDSQVSKAAMRNQFLIIKDEISDLQIQSNLPGRLAYGDLSPVGVHRLITLESDAKLRMYPIPTVVADSGSATDMTEAILLSGVHAKDPTTPVSYQVPTGTEISAAIGKSVTVGDSFEFTLINTGNTTAEDITLTVDTGVTFVGSVILAPAADDPTESSSATWIVRNTAANTWVFYRK